MILSPSEWDSLVRFTHATPHDLLGMHSLPDGVVVRALLPEARAVMAVPTHEKTRPVIPLKRLGDSDLFEGTAHGSAQIYAYDLLVTNQEGAQWQTRDPYSFLPTISAMDLYLFGLGDDRKLYDKMGAQLRVMDGVHGVAFSVWAPNAQRVSVVGDFNGWDGRRHSMRRLGASGVWEIFVPGLEEGAHYKFEIVGADGISRIKTDPFGFFFELAPKNAAIVWNNRRFNGDEDWLRRRRGRDALRSPMSVYEVHLGSWRKKTKAESPGYRELAGPLVDHVRRMGFTHVELMPVAEHAYYPSWGYQVTGFFAPTGRYGTPDDFQFLIHALHEAGIGVIMDWVPAHFPRDDWALAQFDGTALYEHEDPRLGAHQDWGTLIFNFGRNEVRNFLAANALFWCDRFHVDGLRVDAVASMLYLDYSRQEGQWLPNKFGGRENLEAADFLRHCNHLVHTEHPGVMTIAEESTDWPGVSRPSQSGGLGFTFKWDMGWMHDTLRHFAREPVHRCWHQDELTFARLYAGKENYLLPLSHDEVVHGKRSLLGRMPGDEWQRFANLRALLGYQWMFTGKKLLFMGGEFGQPSEWNENVEMEWERLEQGPFHVGLMRWVEDLNKLYRREPALWQADYDENGFYWVDCTDKANCVAAFIRQAPGHSRPVLVVIHLTTGVQRDYRLGLPQGGYWRELLNSDSAEYGGSNVGNSGGVTAEMIGSHHQACSARFTLPPLGILVFQAEG
ncbi:MAG: 1,4-alpha-glucan branching protein GlgB [Pedosphaera sp.]|nr:1,4-alpha-glucan branching protein GlgB [Pedosphaera sp.]